jgi:hypothetical protein
MYWRPCCKGCNLPYYVATVIYSTDMESPVGGAAPEFCSNWWMTCSNRLCICLSIAKVSSPYSWPRAQRTIAADTKKLGWSGKVTVKEHICPTCNGTSPESFHPFTEKFHRVPGQNRRYS